MKTFKVVKLYLMHLSHSYFKAGVNMVSEKIKGEERERENRVRELRAQKSVREK